MLSLEKMRLYHGSSKKLIGKKLIPKKPIDIDNKPSNLARGVYATDLRDAAIAMAIISCNGVRGASLGMGRNIKIPGVIYHGFPKQNYIYLYTLDSKGFKSIGGGMHQFILEKSVKPIKTEKLKVKNYLYLVRKANKKEIKKFDKKLNEWRKTNRKK